MILLKSNAYQSEIEKLRNQLVKNKIECENYKEVYERTWNENEDLKQIQAKMNDEHLKKMYEFKMNSHSS